jgi:hypothetical protein
MWAPWPWALHPATALQSVYTGAWVHRQWHSRRAWHRALAGVRVHVLASVWCCVCECTAHVFVPALLSLSLSLSLSSSAWMIRHWLSATRVVRKIVCLCWCGRARVCAGNNTVWNGTVINVNKLSGDVTLTLQLAPLPKGDDSSGFGTWQAAVAARAPPPSPLLSSPPLYVRSLCTTGHCCCNPRPSPCGV